MYFSSISTEILISEVEIIWMLMPSSESVRNILLAMPTCERMPTPTTDTFDTFGSPDTLAAPIWPFTLSVRMVSARWYSPRGTVNVKSVLPSTDWFWMIMSTSILASAIGPRIW
ncbi:hypothetical protein D3C86_1708630 [compost metagenome]